MLDKAKFFNFLRDDRMLGPVLSPSEVKGVETLLDAAIAKHLSASRIAYILATTYHETAGTMEPIAERGTNAYFTMRYDVTGRKPQRAIRMGNTKPGDGIKYRGRGFVQLTWKVNYDRAGKAIGVDLVKNPDLAMDLKNAARIIVEGMIGGWFTGMSLRVIPEGRAATIAEFVKARPIINGTDKAETIAAYADKFQTMLIKSGVSL